MKPVRLYRSEKGIWHYEVERDGALYWSSLHTRSEQVARAKYERLEAVAKSYNEPNETAIQTAVIEHWQKLGRPNTLVAAIPNARAFGQAGLTKGLPDLLVIGPDVPHGCAFIELKRQDLKPRPRGGLSEDQIAVLTLCNEVGVVARVAYGRDEPIAILRSWDVVR
jgi:hypothetical protein